VRLVVVGPAVENIETHARPSKFRGQAHPVAISPDIPELARKIGAWLQMWLIVARSPIENIETHSGATEHAGEAKRAIPNGYKSPILTGYVLESLQARHVILRATIEDIERHICAPKLGAKPIEEVWIRTLG
jgi:hypothetical protein